MHSSEETTLAIATRLKRRRLAQELTQQGLARRSGVALSTLIKFERSGQISLKSFVRLAIALQDEAALENLMREEEFATLDEVLRSDKKRQRGRIK
jgi:transcriptional regulator with XRE-family HTH domain